MFTMSAMTEFLASEAMPCSGITNSFLHNGHWSTPSSTISTNFSKHCRQNVWPHASSLGSVKTEMQMVQSSDVSTGKVRKSMNTIPHNMIFELISIIFITTKTIRK